MNNKYGNDHCCQRCHSDHKQCQPGGSATEERSLFVDFHHTFVVSKNYEGRLQISHTLQQTMMTCKRVLMQFENTTKRSWWIISDPTYTRGRMFAHQIPPTAETVSQLESDASEPAGGNQPS